MDVIPQGPISVAEQRVSEATARSLTGFLQWLVLEHQRPKISY
jgi:hypothetical protein